MIRRRPAAVLAVLAVFALACEGAGGATPGDDDPPSSALPSSIAALGDSITTGYATCATVVTCGHHSWATGVSSAVDSHYQRILADNPKIRDRRRTPAVAGARAEGLRRQADAAVRAKAQYVTILIGANDACRDSVDDMTPPETFRAQIDSALDRLAAGLPNARVLIVSIPDLHRLWEIGHENDQAVRAWSRGTCPSLLADPRSSDSEDVKRRREVDRRVSAYNRELAAACREYGRRCRWDEGAAHRVRFTLDMLSDHDYFHPNPRGQDKLAEVTYPPTWR